MKFKNIKPVFALLTSLFLSNIFAQNFNDAYRLGEQTYDFDAKTIAMGNSTMALGGGFSSTVLNPAGLALEKLNVTTLSFNSNKMENKSTFFNNNITAGRNNSNFNQFSLIMPLPTKRGSAVLGFGYNQLKDFNAKLEFDGYNPGNTSMIQTLNGEDIIFKLGLSYPVYDENDNYLGDETLINGKLHQSGTIEEEGNLDTWVMSGAFEAAKNVFIGATLNILSGNYKNTRTYTEDDFDFNTYNGMLDPADSNTFDFESFYLNDVIDQNISGWDLRLGLLYKMNDMFSFGASVKLPTSYEIEEYYKIHGESTFAYTGYSFDLPEKKSVYNITIPMELGAGVSANFPFINVNGSINFIDYSQMKFTQGFSTDAINIKNKEIENVFESVVNYNFGSELKFPYLGLKLRGGFIYHPSPYKDDAPEFDKKFVTAGLGIPLAETINFDLTYVHGWWNSFGDNYGVNDSRTTQNINVDKLLLSVSLKFM